MLEKIDSQLSLLTNNNNNINISTSRIWKSWIKPFTLINLSVAVSIITSPIVTITNYWKKTTKFEFLSGWNDFIMSPTIFITSELINSFFYSLAFLKTEFCLDTILNSNLSKKDKLKKINKDAMLVISLLFINELSKNYIFNWFNTKEIWSSLPVDFFLNLGKEIVIVIARKIFIQQLLNIKDCLTNNQNFSKYYIPICIMLLIGTSYIGANIVETLISIGNSSNFGSFIPNFWSIFISNTTVDSFRAINNSLLCYCFSDISKKWKNDLFKKPLQNEVDSLQEVVIKGLTMIDNNFSDIKVIQLKRSISDDSFFNFNIEKVNKMSEQDFILNNSQKNFNL